MDVLSSLLVELETRLRGLVEDERNLQDALAEVREARWRQAGAVDALRLAIQRTNALIGAEVAAENGATTDRTTTDGDNNG